MILRGAYVPLIERGEGKEILFLHGYMSCKESFFYQITYFSKNYRVIAPDICGFGASRPLDRAYSVGDYADWLKEFISAKKLDCPHIIAHSFGARVAFKLLSEEGGFADRLVVTGGAGIVKERSRAYIRRVNAYRRIKKLFPKFAERHFGSEEYRSLSPVMRESYKKVVNEDLRQCAAKITNKTLLLYGRDDTVTPPDEEGKEFHSLISGSEFYLTEGGHFCFSERPDEFNRRVEKFLTDGG